MPNKTKSLFKQYAVANQNKFIESYVGANSLYYRCDPDILKYKETYFKFTYFDQGYVVNERYMIGNTCMYDCSQIDMMKVERCATDSEQGKFPECNEPKRCNTFYNCKYYGTNIKTCTSNNNEDQELGRRYKFIQGIGSPDRQCRNGVQAQSKATFTYYFADCHDCVCFCDDFNYESFRTISLKEQVTTGMEVITGLKVVLKNRVFYLQTQVGTLISRTEIDQNSLRWVPIEEVTNLNYELDSPPDYFVMRRNNRFDMDIYTIEDDEYITGEL